MEYDLHNLGVVNGLIQDITKDQNKRRKRREREAWEIYQGMSYNYVSERLKELFPETHTQMRVSDIQVVPKVVNKLAKSYKEIPIRKLETPEESEDYQILLRDTGMNWRMSTFDKRFNTHDTAAVWVNLIDQENMQFAVRVLGPDQFDRVVDSLGRTKVFIVGISDYDAAPGQYGDGLANESGLQDELDDRYAQREHYLLWNDTQHVMVCRDAKGICKFMPIPGNEGGINILGMIPAAFAQKSDHDSVQVSNPLVQQSIEWNALNSSVLSGVDVNTFGSLILQHPDEQEFETIKKSIFRYIDLPQISPEIKTEAKYINPGSDLAASRDVLRDYLADIIAGKGIEGGELIRSEAQSYNSGLDRALSMSSTTDLIEDNQKFYFEVEDSVYKIIKKWHEARNIFTFKSESLTTIYQKPKPQLSEDKLLDIIERKLRIGMIEEWEKFQLEDPNVSDDEAKEKLERIEAARRERINALLPTPPTPEVNPGDAAV